MSQHHATFNWGVGPNSVFIAGGFNNWSDTASPLQKQPDGSFKAEIPVPWGEKQAFKYVVDGEWKVREDEAKEWDAAGNMNNVYTAPHAPEPKPEPTPAPASAGVAGVASSYQLGAPVSGSATKDLPSSTATGTTTTGPTGIPAGTIPTGTASTAAPAVSKAEEIEKTAAAAPIGEAKTAPQEQDEGILGRATAIGATALAGLGAAATAAAVAVEKATGVDLAHGNPLTVEEAKAKGIDVSSLTKRDGPTDAISPVGQKPPQAAVQDLSDKLGNLNLPNGSAKSPANDIPAQHETQANHQTIPAPVITAISDKDPKKDRTLEGTSGVGIAESKPIDSNPSSSALAEKNKAEDKAKASAATAAQPPKSSLTTSTSTPITGAAATGPLPAGQTSAAPDRKSANTTADSAPAPAPPTKESAAPAPAVKTSNAAQGAAPAFAAASVPAASPAAATSTPSTATPAATSVAASPAAVAAASPAAAATPAAPATPAKTANGPASAVSTPASTPAKPAHKKDGTDASGNIKKKKSSFLHKIKSAFSPKNKDKN